MLTLILVIMLLEIALFVMPVLVNGVPNIAIFRASCVAAGDDTLAETCSVFAEAVSVLAESASVLPDVIPDRTESRPSVVIVFLRLSTLSSSESDNSETRRDFFRKPKMFGV